MKLSLQDRRRVKRDLVSEFFRDNTVEQEQYAAEDSEYHFWETINQQPTATIPAKISKTKKAKRLTQPQLNRLLIQRLDVILALHETHPALVDWINENTRCNGEVAYRLQAWDALVELRASGRYIAFGPNGRKTLEAKDLI